MKNRIHKNRVVLVTTATILAFAVLGLADSAEPEEKEDQQTIQALKAKIEELERKNQGLQAALDEMSNPLSIAAVADWKLVQALQGASVFAQNEKQTFLGVLDFTGTDLDSIFNEVGRHGSPAGIESIWNNAGLLGSEFGLHSARNKVCIKPPLIVKNDRVIGHLTVNPVAVSPARVDPNHLRYLAKRIQGKK